MTALVTNQVISTISSNTYEVLSTTLGIVVLALAMILLLEKEMWRARGSAPAELRAFDVAIMPLLVPFAVIIGMRFINILLAAR